MYNFVIFVEICKKKHSLNCINMHYKYDILIELIS